MNAPGFGFLKRPGLPGLFGALMDEYARAAEDYCRAVEALTPEVYAKPRPSDDPDTVSMQTICAHAVGAARRYSDYIRRARGLPYADKFVADPQSVATPAVVRPALAAAMQYTEESLAGWYEDPMAAAQIKFEVRWGPTYDCEMILEHAIVHLLRHRRQIERW
jgi:hypothetical protein